MITGMTNMNPMTKYEQKCAKIMVRIRKDKEPELLEFLNTVDNKSEYIKRLIRNDMNLREVMNG